MASGGFQLLFWLVVLHSSSCMPLGMMILIDKVICELWKTNMASEHVSFLDVVPLKSGDVV